MNISIFFSTEEANIKNLSELFYLRIGSTWTYDSIYLFFIAPLSFAAMMLNAFSLFVITKIRIKNSTIKFYEYLKIDLINGIVMCLLGLTAFVGYSPRYFQFSLSLIGRVYKCFIFNILGSTIYLFSNLLTLLILLDRLSIFIVKLKYYLNFSSPYKQTALMFVFCVFVNMPLYFWNYVKQDDEFYAGALDVNNLDSFTFCGKTDFYKSLFGKIVSFLSLFIQDGIELLFEISLNTFTIIYYFRFIKKKSTLNMAVQLNRISNFNHRRERINSLSSSSSSDRKLIIMTIYLSILSMISHMIALVRSIVLINNTGNGLITFLIVLIGVMSKALNQFSNFFIFYFFNRNFRNVLKTKMRTNESTATS